MPNVSRHFDAGSLLVIFITFALFALALYFTGLTHDLLLEAGVFLVSVKLIMMSYKHAIASDKLHEELAEIRSMLREVNGKLPPGQGSRP